MGVILIVLQISHDEHFLKEIMFGVQHFVMYASIKSLSFLCWTLCIVGQKVSTKALIVG